EELREAQVLEPGRAELLRGLVLQVDWLEDARRHRPQVLVPALERELDRRREQVDVLRAREVRQEREDQAERAPPAHVPADHPALAWPDQAGERGGDGLERVGVVLGGEQERLGGEAEADVEEDEEPDDERVAPDPSPPDLL